MLYRRTKRIVKLRAPFASGSPISPHSLSQLLGSLGRLGRSDIYAAKALSLGRAALRAGPTRLDITDSSLQQ